MSNALLAFSREGAGANAAVEVVSLVLGAGFTAALFLGVAHFEGPAPQATLPDLADLRVISLPAEAPPPRPVEQPVEAIVQPFAGLEVGANDSSVRIAVVPPDLSQLLRTDRPAPAAKIEPARLFSEFKPRAELDGDFGRIFQVSEVDQRPYAVVRPAPTIPPLVAGTSKFLRIVTLILINADGSVANIRVLESSGNKYFDEIILRDFRESWVFSPAVRKGRKVRCLTQQNVRVEFTSNSPFETR